MINSVVLVGRLTKDIELKKTPNNTSTCTFTLACDRRFKDENGNTQADFIQCVAWRQSADYLAQYAVKGGVIGIEGSIQTRNYEGQNGRVYVTEVICSQVKLIGEHKRQQTQQPQQQSYQPQNNQGYGYQAPAYNQQPAYQGYQNGYDVPQGYKSGYDEPQGYQQTITGDGKDLTGYTDPDNGLHMNHDDLPFY